MKIALAITSVIGLLLVTSYISASIFSWGLSTTWKKEILESVFDRPYVALGLFILFVVCVGIAAGAFISIPLKKLGYIN